jgi:hypothetical protein
MPHVSRVTESLSLVDATHMSRKVGIDLNVDGIPMWERQVLAADNRVPLESLWLPLERHSRKSLTSVIVHDGDGRVVPRMTGTETSTSIGSGLARLFRLIAHGHPDALDRTSDVHKVLNNHVRALWLCEAAVAMLTDRGPGSLSDSVMTFAPSNKSTDASEIRRLAIVFARKVTPKGSPYHELLAIGSSEYLLVAKVPIARREIYLEYEAPLLPALQRGRFAGLIPTSWLPLSSSEYTLQYDLQVPRGVNSYHLALEVPAELVVRRFVLSGDGDQPEMTRIRDDLTSIADDLESAPASPDKIQELELQSVASRLSELGRRRRAESLDYRRYVKHRFGELTGPGPWIRQKSPGGLGVVNEFPRLFARIPFLKRFWNRLVLLGVTRSEPFTLKGLDILASGQDIIDDLWKFASDYESGLMTKLADDAVPDTLRTVGRRLSEMECEYEVYPDNDPRENASHAQWRRHPGLVDSRPGEPVRLRVCASIADDAPSLSGSVFRLLVAITCLLLGVKTLLVGWGPQIWGFAHPLLAGDTVLPSADALVTVLLLIPGLLLTRLDLPSHMTVLGRLRLLPRYLAYLGVGASYLMALVVATSPGTALGGWLDGVIFTLLFLTAISIWESVVRGYRRRSLTLRMNAIPRWLRSDLRWLPSLSRKAHVRFSNLEDGS